MNLEDKNLKHLLTVSQIVDHLIDSHLLVNSNDIWDFLNESDIAFGSDHTVTLVEAWYFEKLLFEFFITDPEAFSKAQEVMKNGLYIVLE